MNLSIKKLTAAILAIIGTALLCGCNNGNTQTNANTETSTEAAELSETASETAPIESTFFSEEQTEAVITTTAEPLKTYKEWVEELNFYPILTEEDIEYHGIPYKDLTKDQFIQMFGQATKENNLQKLYVLYYDNTYHDNIGMTEEEIAEREKKFIISQLKQSEMHSLNGCMWEVFENPELQECTGEKGEVFDYSVPEGYYDYSDDEDVEKIYAMIADYKMYSYGELMEEFPRDTRWVTIKRTNGYWKIGLSFSTSPPTRERMENLDKKS